jgi:hypothetical protein
LRSVDVRADVAPGSTKTITHSIIFPDTEIPNFNCAFEVRYYISVTAVLSSTQTQAATPQQQPPPQIKVEQALNVVPSMTHMLRGHGCFRWEKPTVGGWEIIPVDDDHAPHADFNLWLHKKMKNPMQPWVSSIFFFFFFFFFDFLLLSTCFSNYCFALLRAERNGDGLQSTKSKD